MKTAVIISGGSLNPDFALAFLRKEEPYFSLPVSIVTDTDIKFYKKTPRKDDEENVVKDENGKIIYNYEKENLRDIVGKVKQKTIQLNTVDRDAALYWIECLKNIYNLVAPVK